MHFSRVWSSRVCLCRVWRSSGSQSSSRRRLLQTAFVAAFVFPSFPSQVRSTRFYFSCCFNCLNSSCGIWFRFCGLFLVVSGIRFVARKMPWCLFQIIFDTCFKMRKESWRSGGSRRRRRRRDLAVLATMYGGGKFRRLDLPVL
jgi:hypothetical protein